jgi:HlyD family secretion protein
MKVLRRLARPTTLGGLVLLGTLLAIGFWPSAELVDLATVERGPMQVTVDEEGETRVRHRFVVSAPVSGQLQRIDLEPGDVVRNGTTVLATVLPATPLPLDARARAEAEAAAAAAAAALGAARADLARATAARALAESELARYRDLARENVVSSQVLEGRETDARAAAETHRAAEFAVAGAQHQIEMAKARLMQASGGRGLGRALTIVSPVDGVVLRRRQESEAVVAAGQPLLEIGDPRDLEIVSDLLSSDAVRVPPGAAVLIERWGGDRPLRARVRRVEPSGFTKISALGVEEQRVNVVMDFDEPAGGRPGLGDGYRVDVRIIVWEGQSVLQVPASALFRRGAEWAAFVETGGRADLRAVRINRRNGSEAEITDGLREGDRVVLHPADSLTHGARIARRQ